MNRIRFYLLLIGLLLLSNLATVFFVIEKGKHKDVEQGPKNIIIEKLAFDKQQSAAYQKLIDQHRKDIGARDQEIILLKKELYSLLRSEGNELMSDSLTTEIGRIQKEIESTHLEHFKDIRAICKPEQRERFNGLLDELEILFRKNIHSSEHK